MSIYSSQILNAQDLFKDKCQSSSLRMSSFSWPSRSSLHTYLPDSVWQQGFSPPFSTSIALASRFKGTGLSSLTPGASRSQRRSKQVSPHLYLPASRWHQGLKKQVCPPFIQQHRAARQGLNKQVCPPFLQEHRAPREGSSPVASPASPSSI